MRKSEKYVSLLMVLIMMLSTLHLSVLAENPADTAQRGTAVTVGEEVSESLDSSEQEAEKSAPEGGEMTDSESEMETDPSAIQSAGTEDDAEGGENEDADDLKAASEAEDGNSLSNTGSNDNDHEEDYVNVGEDVENVENVEPGRKMNSALLSSDGSEEKVLVTLNANGGYFEVFDGATMEYVAQASTVVEVPVGEKLENYMVWPEYADPDFYVSGWSEVKDGGIIDDFSEFCPETDMTLYAEWSKYKKIQFDANGGFFPENCSDMTNADRTIYTVRTSKAGVVTPSERPQSSNESEWFRGWSDAQDGDVVISYDAGEYFYPSEMDMEDGATYYAVWGGDVTVTLNSNGHYFKVFDGATMEYVAQASTQINIPREEPLGSYIYYPESDDPDYYVSGWSITQDGDPIDDIYNFIPEQGMTLYAVWSKYKKIQFDANGGVFPENCSDMTNADRTIYTVRIPAYNDVKLPSERPYYMDDSMSIIGWSDEKDGEVIISYEGSGWNYPSETFMEDGATYYAVWGETVTITLNANGGLFEVWDEESEENRLVTTTQIKGSKQTNLDLPTPFHDDDSLVFMGWSETPDGNKGRWYSKFDEDTTLYAVWKESIIVTLDFNGGFCGDEVYDDILEEYQYDAEIIKKKIAPGGGIYLGDDAFSPSINDQGKSFAGWSLSKDGKILNIMDTFYPEKSCTLYAVWKDAFIVTFDLNGGYCENNIYDDILMKRTTRATVVQLKMVSGEAIPSQYKFSPVHTESEKFFKGWSLTRNGKPIEGTRYGEYFPTGSCTLYAVWGETYQLTFDANGGTFDQGYDDEKDEYVSNVSTLKKNVREYIYLPKCNYLHNADENLMFYGWSLTKDGEPLTENDGYYYPEESCTLYAIWKAPISVKLDAMGGFFTESFNADWDDEWPNAETLKSRYTITESGMTIETATGRAILLPEPEYKDDDRAFEGWSLIQNGVPVQLNDWGGNIYEVTEPCTLYARWAPTYTVTFDAGEGYFEIDDVGTPAKTCVQKIARHSAIFAETIAYSLYNDNKDRELLGWSLTPGGEVVADPSFDQFYKPSGDCTLYAVWTSECTITYDANGGYYRIESEDDGYKDKDYAQTWDVPCLIGEKTVFHPGDYLRSDDPSIVFAGWSIDKTGSYVFKDDLYHMKATFMNGGLKGDTTLYAIWKKSDCRVTIDFNGSFLNDSYFSEQIEFDAISGKELCFNTYDLIYPDNKGLAGFSLSKDSHTVVTEHGEDYADGFSSQYYYTPSKSCTLYAVWGDLCTIKLDANGGYFGDSLYDQGSGRDYATYRRSLARPGVVNRSFDTSGYDRSLQNAEKVFAGWSLSKDGEVDVEAGASFIPSGDSTLYAVWQDSGNVSVTKITLSKSSLTLEKDGTASLMATVEPENATDKTVVWTSSNEKVATVDKNGKVTAIAKGSAVITAKAADQSGVQASCTVTVKETPSFTDVSSSYAFANEIKWAAENGIVSGYDDGTFKPQESCKRKQVVAFLWRMAGTPKPASLDARFKDVSTKTSFYKAIYWASENKIVLGFGDGTFRPDDTCTRGQVVAFLWRMAGRPAPKATASKFSDVSKTNSFYKAILWATENGIVKGYGDGTFRPENECTRAQIVTFIYRYKHLK